MREMRSRILDIATGDLHSVKSYAGNILIPYKAKLFQSLFSGHLDAALDPNSSLKEQNLDFLAAMLIFRARSDANFQLDQKDIRLLNANPAVKQAVLDRVGMELGKLAIAENSANVYEKIVTTLT